MRPTNSIVRAAELRRHDLLAAAARERLLDQAGATRSTTSTIALHRISPLHTLRSFVLALVVQPRTAIA